MVEDKTVKLTVSNKNTRLQITENLFPSEEVNNIRIIDGFNNEEEYPDSTLKDISIIMYSMVGEGVNWQLADELSKRFGLNSYEVSKTLMDIFEEYYDISDEEDSRRWENCPKLYPPLTI